MSKRDVIKELAEVVDSSWSEIKNGQYFTHYKENKITTKVYKAMMAQCRFFVSENSRNQAIAASKLPARASGLQKFIFDHARGEYGHEEMIMNDLKSIGISEQEVLAEPMLPATSALIDYLYGIALRYGGIARLGYSFWAEGSYEYLEDDFVQPIRRDLELEDENLTFFITHARIDEVHFAQVKENIRKYCTKAKDKREIKRVAETTLYLTGNILDSVAHKYG